jgi:WD40 repeat protein
MLYELIFDARRFAQTFADSIEEHPLLVYHSALPFAPTTSAVYRMFHNDQIFPFIVGGFQKSWSPLLMVLSTHNDLVLSVAFSPDGSRIVSGSRDMTIRVWDTVSGAQSLGPLRGHINEVSSVAFSPDGATIVSGSDDRTVRVWDATAGGEICPTRQGHTRPVTSVIVSPDGTRIASGSLDHTIRIWQATSTSDNKSLAILRGHGDWVREVRFSPNGHRIVSCSDDMTIRIWDVTMGREICPALREHNRLIRSVSWSPDGKYIASGSSDSTVRIRALTSDSVFSRAVSTIYEGPIRSVAFSPDGEHIVAGSADNTVRIWNLRSGVSATFHGHAENVNSVSFSPDGSQVASGSDDHSVRIWNATAIVGGSDSPPPMRNSWNISGLPHIPMSYRPTMPTVQIEDPPVGFLSNGAEIFEIEGGWIVEKASQRTISKLPRFISLLSWSAFSTAGISLLTHSGQVVVLHFPTSSPDEH